MTKLQIALLGAVLIVLLAVLDYITGAEISFSFLYLFPVVIITWYYSLPAGLSSAVLSIIVWMIVNELAGENFSSEVVRYWNAGIRIVFFSIVVVLLSDLKKALERLAHLSRTDPLTSAYNSREFHRLAELEIARARRYNRPLAVAFIDVDNFKTINDRFGHAVGDQLLQSIAKIITLGLRMNDILGRIGGDEFVLILPEADITAAETALGKVRRMIRDDLHDKEWKTTLSIGAVVYDCPPQSVDEILRQADLVMYRVKLKDKNDMLILNGNDVTLKP